MKKTVKTLKQTLVGTIALSVLLGCGSSGSRNDQGVSFTLYGMFSDATCSSGLVGIVGSLSSDPESDTSGGFASGTGAIAYLGLQNNLASGIRSRRIYLNYYIEGSDLQPPPTSQAFGIFLGPGSPNDNSSLPESVTGPGTKLGNVGCGGFEVVPPEILSYLNLNRNRLPELPFKMRVEVSVNGVSTAGDDYTSNPLDFHVEFTQDNIIAPSPGSGEGSSSSAGAAEIVESDDSTGSDGTEQNGEIIPVIPGTDQPAV